MKFLKFKFLNLRVKLFQLAHSFYLIMSSNIKIDEESKRKVKFEVLKYLQWRVYVQRKSILELKGEEDPEKLKEFAATRQKEIEHIESHIPLDDDYQFYDDEKYACDFHYHYLEKNNGTEEQKNLILYHSKYLQMYMDLLKNNLI